MRRTILPTRRDINTYFPASICKNLEEQIYLKHACHTFLSTRPFLERKVVQCGISKITSASDTIDNYLKISFQWHVREISSRFKIKMIIYTDRQNSMFGSRERNGLKNQSFTYKKSVYLLYGVIRGEREAILLIIRFLRTKRKNCLKFRRRASLHRSMFALIHHAKAKARVSVDAVILSTVAVF